MTAVLTVPRRRRSLPAAQLAAVLAALTLAPSALADATQSSNWAGYAAHSPRVRFTRVSAAWRQPTATCTPGTAAYSSQWVGLGGYSANASALEQIGSELDCTSSGRVVSSVWYELVPAPSRTVRMTVNPGDQLTASVTVNGHVVRLQLSDLTRHTIFSRTVHADQLDVSSADWIVEAPSECSGSNSCQQLALANFGTTAMTRASTVTSTGHTAVISDPLWTTTAITLASTGRHFVGSGGDAGANANPSSLVFGASAFAVTYAGTTAPGAAAGGPAGQRVRGAPLVRPGRRGTLLHNP